MEVKDLMENSKVENLKVSIKEKGENRELSNGSKVLNFIIGDETGEIKMVLWNRQIPLVEDVDEFEVVLGWCGKDSNGNKQISLGRYGKLRAKGTLFQIENERVIRC